MCIRDSRGCARAARRGPRRSRAHRQLGRARAHGVVGVRGSHAAARSARRRAEGSAMTTTPPPSKPSGKAGKPGSPKPFLGDDDLSEIDAWVETFDALHMGPDHEDDFSAMSDATALADGPLVPRRGE